MNITSLFRLQNARSHNLSDYDDGTIPFVSNSNLNNGIVRYVKPIKNSEIIDAPTIAVNGFGFATLQLKPFIGAGNGGVHIIALKPKKEMKKIELVYYAAQINYYSWRFSYGRRAIKHRLSQLDLVEVNLEADDFDLVRKFLNQGVTESLSQLL